MQPRGLIPSRLFGRFKSSPKKKETTYFHLLQYESQGVTPRCQYRGNGHYLHEYYFLYLDGKLLLDLSCWQSQSSGSCNRFEAPQISRPGITDSAAPFGQVRDHRHSINHRVHIPLEHRLIGSTYKYNKAWIPKGNSTKRINANTK